MSSSTHSSTSCLKQPSPVPLVVEKTTSSPLSTSSSKQHVRFNIEEAAERKVAPSPPQKQQAKPILRHDLGPVSRVQCKMVTSDEMRRERRVPVSIVWKNDLQKGRGTKFEGPPSIEEAGEDLLCCNRLRERARGN